VRREAPAPFVPFAGSAMGAAVYAFVLILVAYCAGIELFGADWLGAGALESKAGAAREWWRAVTALTLHLDQEHLLGHLLFGIGIGVLAGRMFGPGCAWLGILLSGAAANFVDMLVSPLGHRAVGASTAVFAALGLLAGFGWGERRGLRDRRFYRWAPLFAGVCLLALLGAGTEHVDVLGHLLGFMTGTAVGWMFAHAGLPRTRSAAFQLTTGAISAAILGGAWFLALRHAR
jgi:rhomboid protease GluP